MSKCWHTCIVALNKPGWLFPPPTASQWGGPRGESTGSRWCPPPIQQHHRGQCCLLWLQGRWGFPQASVVQRSDYPTFLWWSRKNQGWDQCSPGNRKRWRLCGQRRLWRRWSAEDRKWWHLHAHFFHGIPVQLDRLLPVFLSDHFSSGTLRCHLRLWPLPH